MAITPDQFRNLSATYHNTTTELSKMFDILDQHVDGCRLDDHPENLTGAQIAEFQGSILRLRSSWIQVQQLILESGRNTAIVARYWADNQCVLTTYDEWQVMLAAAERMVHADHSDSLVQPSMQFTRMLNDADSVYSGPMQKVPEPDTQQPIQRTTKPDAFSMLYMLIIGILIGAFLLR